MNFETNTETILKLRNYFQNSETTSETLKLSSKLPNYHINIFTAAQNLVSQKNLKKQSFRDGADSLKGKLKRLDSFNSFKRTCAL